MKKLLNTLMAGTLAAALALSAVGCGEKKFSPRNNETDALRLSIQPVEGLFSPFFSTAATDSSVTGMTQLSMLTTNDSGELAFGDDYPCVVKDYSERMFDKAGEPTTEGKEDGSTVYQFVIKNGIKFSDGQDLTIKDVLFNLYVYLDPVYTGSTTIYSTDIVGLKAYQSLGMLNEDDNDANPFDSSANSAMQTRISNLSNWLTKPENSSFITVDEAAQAEKDAKRLAELFKAELEVDWNSAIANLETYQKEYVVSEPWQVYLLTEGVTSIKVETIGTVSKPVKQNGKYVIDYDTLQGVDLGNHDKNTMINYVYSDYYRADALSRGNSSTFARVINWSSGSTLRDEIAAAIKSKLIQDAIANKDDNPYYRETVEGITVHKGTDFVPSAISTSKTPYGDDYYLLEVKINGIDPKAIWNFGFTVAPMHYYSNAEVTNKYDSNKDYHSFNAPGVDGYDDTKDVSFGFPVGDYEYFTSVIQARNKVPMGAGVYQATDINDSDNFNALVSGFNSNGIIYYKRNNYFNTCMKNGENAKIKYVRYKILDTTNVLNALTSGEIDYTDISATTDNISVIDGKNYLARETVRTNGYGYIGINAGKIEDTNLRKAIMSVFDANLVQSYYPGNLSERINRPLSTCSWVYDYGEVIDQDEEGNDIYARWQPEPVYNYDVKNPDRTAYDNYMEAARSSCNLENVGGKWYYYPYKSGPKTQLKFTFTIAGGSDDHPAYQTLSQAADFLNSNGWDITINPDSRALTLLASGSLTVWCAAWSATIDPDMYQVYHMDSKTTNVKAWGYSTILQHAGSDDYNNLVALSELIDKGRTKLDREERAPIYQQALTLVMDLAIEYPLYQRCDLYAYNTQIIDSDTLHLPASTYASPIDKLWQVSFKGSK